MKEVEVVNFNLKRKLLLFFINISFILVGVFLVIKSNDFKPFWIIKSAWILRIAGFLAIGYFGMVLVSYLKIAFRKAALIIDGEGIIDHSNFIGVGRILWSQVAEIKTYDAGLVSYILIYVDDPATLIERNRNFFERWHLRKNARRYRTPIAIPMTWLHIYIDDLKAILLTRYDLYKKSNCLHKTDNNSRKTAL